MKLASRDRLPLAELLRHKAFLARKGLYRALRCRRDPAKPVVVVLGCQRSGTTLLSHMFNLDLASRIYEEMDPPLVEPSAAAEFIRLRPLPRVREHLAADRARFVLIKPLVESQRAHALLDELPTARVVWLYRHHLDVARSNLALFGRRNGIDDLRPIAAGAQDDWRCQDLPAAAQATIGELFREDMDELSAAALFWWARNTLFFAQDLAVEPRVRVLRYDDLVTAPAAVMRELYAWLGLPYPGDRITADVFASSVGRGRDLGLEPQVTRLCEDMLARLEALPRLAGGAPASAPA